MSLDSLPHDALLDLARRQHEMLERLQWTGLPHYGIDCPLCGGQNGSGHATDCALAALLADGRGGGERDG